MEKQQSKDPLHGVTLKTILEQLESYFGFDTLGEFIPLNVLLKIQV
jgi:uncharacterized protein (DUF2132 family)